MVSIVLSEGAQDRCASCRRSLAPPWTEAGAKAGTGVVLLPSVVVGAGALIGAGSLVTRDVAPGTTVDPPV